MGKVIPFRPPCVPPDGREEPEKRDSKWALADYQILAILAQDLPKTPEQKYQEHLSQLAKFLSETKED